MTKYIPPWPMILIALTGLLYIDTFTHDFSYDDLDTLANNRHIQKLSNWPALFSPERYFGISREISYRPVVTLAYFVEAALFDMKPLGFHAVGVLLHALCGILTAWIAIRIGLPCFYAFFTAAIFVAHPVATEAVNGVGFLEDILSLLFLLLGVAGTLTEQMTKGARIGLVMLAYFLALLSKEVAILFPIPILYMLKHCGWDGRSLRTLGLALGAALAAYAGLRFYVFVPSLEQLAIYKPVVLPPLPRLYTMSGVLVNQIRLFFIPVGQSAAHVVMIHDRVDWTVGLSFAVIIAFAILVFRNGDWKVRFGGLWCLLGFLPVAQFVTTSQPMTERFWYGPLFGASLALAAAWTRQFPGSTFRNRWVPVAAVVILGLLTFFRNPVWQNQETLFQDAVRKNPNSSFAWNVLGVGAVQRGEYKMAEDYVKIAVKIHPDHYHYRKHLAMIYFYERRYEDAILLLQELLRLQPEDGHAQSTLAWCYWLTHQPEQCRRQMEAARGAGYQTPETRAALEELEQRIKGTPTPPSESPALY